MLFTNKYKDDSIRLKNYDYTKEGSYFITICTENKECLFGYIDNSKMILNDAGIMLGKWYLEMENKYPNIRCCEYVAMPNHFHCIITIMTNIETPDAHERNRIKYNKTPDAHERNRIKYNKTPDAHVGAPLRGRPSPEKRVVSGSRGRRSHENGGSWYGPNNKKYNATIPKMVDWFKTMTTNGYIHGVKNHHWPRFDRKLWQKNYWDHIIRSEADLIRIRKYIINNPAKWEIDKFIS